MKTKEQILKRITEYRVAETILEGKYSDIAELQKGIIHMGILTLEWVLDTTKKKK